VLSGRIAPDVSKYRNAAFFSVRLDPEKRRRHYDPSKCQEPLTHKTWKARQLPRDNRGSLKVVPLPCRTSALTCFLSCGVAKQEGLLASLAGIEGLRVVTLARSFKVKCRYFIHQTHFFSYKSTLNSLLF